MKLKLVLSASLLSLASNASAIELLCDECIGGGDIKTNSVTSEHIKNRTIKAADISKGQIVKSVNGLKDNVTVVGGKNVTVTTDGNQLVIDAAVLVTGGSGGGQYDEAIADLQKTLAKLKNTVTDLEALHGDNGAFVEGLTLGDYEYNTSQAACRVSGGPLLDGRSEWIFACRYSDGTNLDISLISGDITGHPYESEFTSAGIDQLNGRESSIWGLVLSSNYSWFDYCVRSNDEGGIVSVKQLGDTLSFKFYEKGNTVSCGFSSKLLPPAETGE